MAKYKNIVCVDSCAFISHLKGGSDRSAQDAATCRDFFDSVTEEDSPIYIYFSTMERAEILQCQLPDGAMNKFKAILDRPNAEEVSISPGISEIAADLRNYLVIQKQTHRSIFDLSTSDSIVVATAIYYECNALLTYDGVREPPNKPRRLLSLGSLIQSKYLLNICKPLAEQMALALI